MYTIIQAPTCSTVLWRCYQLASTSRDCSPLAAKSLQSYYGRSQAKVRPQILTFPLTLNELAFLTNSFWNLLHLCDYRKKWGLMKMITLNVHMYTFNVHM